MAIADLTITNEELEGKKISDIVGDTLVGTPAENKQKFDDYSDVLKEKFNELIDELVNLSPQSNVLEGVQVNGIDLTVSGKKVNIPLASTTNDGAMSTADKTKLDGLNKTTTVASGETGIPTSGAVHSAIQNVAGIASDTADYVVSYETMDAPNGFYTWEVRKWNSGFCEAWINDYTYGYVGNNIYELSNGMCIIGVSNVTDMTEEGFRYPTGLFVDVPPTSHIWISAGMTIYSRLSYICLRARTTDNQFIATPAFQILCARKPSSTADLNYNISAYVTGRWK